MDIKLGTVLYDATDSSITEAKRLKMEEQSRTRTSGRMGMSITGLQVYIGCGLRIISPRVNHELTPPVVIEME
jgi:hypothetical protein